MEYLDFLARISVCFVLGIIIGLERQYRRKIAGIRTITLVSLGAFLFVSISDFTAPNDVTRIAAQVVAGIGFLGAGTIIVTKHNQIKGLTTAAGLWASAGVGLALGIGFYEAALTATLGIYTILTVLQRWERKVHKKIRFIELYVELLGTTLLSEFTQKLRALDLKIEGIQFESDGNLECNTRGIIITLKSKKREDHFLLREKIRKIEGVVYLEEL